MFKKLIASIITLSACISANYKQIRTKFGNKEMNYLKSKLSIKHKNLFFEISQASFNNNLDSITKELTN